MSILYKNARFVLFEKTPNEICHTRVAQSLKQLISMDYERSKF